MDIQDASGSMYSNALGLDLRSLALGITWVPRRLTY